MHSPPPQPPRFEFDLEVGRPKPPPSRTSAEGRARLARWLPAAGPLAAALLFLATKGKWLLLAGKFLLPVLKTGGTMLLSIWLYATQMGWPFAVGFVVGIFVHEMGHVLAAWRLGIPVSAPVFIPFAGAFILQKRAAKSAWDEAVVGIGGPLAGTAAGVAFLLLAAWTDQPLFRGLALVTFLLNLFNLAPVFPLDGGWITGAISPRLWLVGLAIMAALFFSGRLMNPLLLLLLLISLPRVWHGLRHGQVLHPGQQPATPAQRWAMGGAYLGLVGLLLWLMTLPGLVQDR